MKHLPYLLFLLVATPLAAQPSTDSLLRSAEAAYNKGDHQRALLLYDSVNTQMTSASLLYNIGNCWSKLGDVPHAILYYERALRLAPGAEDVQANLDMERAKVVDRVNELPAFTLGSVWDRLQGGSDVDQWARRSLWACAAMALSAITATWLRARSAKRILLGFASLALVATVGSAMLAFYRIQQVQDHSAAIIMVPAVEIVGEPRTGSTRLFMLHQGTKLSTLKRQGDWQEVRLSSGAVGWLPLNAIEAI